MTGSGCGMAGVWPAFAARSSRCGPGGVACRWVDGERRRTPWLARALVDAGCPGPRGGTPVPAHARFHLPRGVRPPTLACPTGGSRRHPRCAASMMRSAAKASISRTGSPSACFSNSASSAILSSAIVISAVGSRSCNPNLLRRSTVTAGGAAGRALRCAKGSAGGLLLLDHRGDSRGWVCPAPAPPAARHPWRSGPLHRGSGAARTSATPDARDSLSARAAAGGRLPLGREGARPLRRRCGDR